jgi:uncharacterized protein YqgC (DUF456 family)
MSDISLQTTLIIVIGFFGCFVPVLPGPPLVWLGVLFYAWRTEWQQVSVATVVVLLPIAIAASTSNLWLSALGAKKTGASGWSTLASFVGGLIGLAVASLPGMLIGAVGAIVAVEYSRHRDWHKVVRASGGYIAGYLLSMLVEVATSVLMTVVLLLAIRF